MVKFMNNGVAVVLGLGSDIGRELAFRYSSSNWIVWGTHRDPTGLSKLPLGVKSVFCDLTDIGSLENAVTQFKLDNLKWDLLIIAAGTEEPIGSFWECDDDAWDSGIQINALAPLRFVRQIYSYRNQNTSSSVAFFSGSGTNNAAPAYSAYSASKIMLIKMCELLDSESPDTSFFIIGPGIVRTKIHQQTLKEPERSGSNYQKVIEYLGSDNMGTSHDDIFNCLNWCHKAGKKIIGGRNIALVNDAWRNGGHTLMEKLKNDSDLYKLRRFGNDLKIQENNI